MDADEREICNYLKGWPGQFIGTTEILRRAGGKRRFRMDPNWAVPILTRLVDKGIIEADSTGHYRLRPPREEDKKKRRWVSPHIRRILERSGKEFEVIKISDEGELEE